MGERPDGTPFFRAGSYVLENVRFVGSPFSDVQLRLETMGNLGIDEQLVSPNPITYFYRQPAATATHFDRLHNDLVAEICRAAPQLHGCCALPLQDPEASCAELTRAVEELGLVASYVGTDVGGVPLSDPRFEELWSEHERLGVPVVVHPGPRTVDTPGDPLFAPWDLDIVYGFLVDEALAVAHLLYAGVLDRHPGLRVHVPHGGGFAPASARLDDPQGRGRARDGDRPQPAPADARRGRERRRAHPAPLDESAGTHKAPRR